VIIVRDPTNADFYGKKILEQEGICLITVRGRLVTDDLPHHHHVGLLR
jgi:hypothetical protein